MTNTTNVLPYLLLCSIREICDDNELAELNFLYPRITRRSMPETVIIVVDVRMLSVLRGSFPDHCHPCSYRREVRSTW